MNYEDIIKEFGIEIAIENILPKITEKMNIYNVTRDENTKKELASLLLDREKIYRKDEQIIKKYIKW